MELLNVLSLDCGLMPHIDVRLLVRHDLLKHVLLVVKVILSGVHKVLRDHLMLVEECWGRVR